MNRLAEGVKKEFLSNLSHELRNPLAAMLSSVELLQLREECSPEGSQLLTAIKERITTMSSMLDNLLEVSRVARHNVFLSPTTVSNPEGSRSVLVVDDNEMAAFALGQLLRLRGYAVTIAHNGTDAVAKALELRPQIIILDIGLPDKDGYEVARILGEQKDFLPVIIALTGYGNEDDKARAAAAGFRQHLTKPVDFKEIEAVLQSVLPA